MYSLESHEQKQPQQEKPGECGEAGDETNEEFSVDSQHRGPGTYSEGIQWDIGDESSVGDRTGGFNSNNGGQSCLGPTLLLKITRKAG